jgi:hypothetical protein
MATSPAWFSRPNTRLLAGILGRLGPLQLQQPVLVAHHPVFTHHAFFLQPEDFVQLSRRRPSPVWGTRVLEKWLGIQLFAHQSSCQRSLTAARK